VSDPTLPANSELAQQLKGVIRQALLDANTPGAAVAVLLDGQPAFIEGIGFSDLAQTTALHAHARFYIYSVTKTLIAAAMLQLVDEGRVGLDTAVQTYLDELPLTTPVTIRQLLNHTGGIPDYGGLPAYFEALKANPRQAWSPEEFLAATLPQGLLFPPGQGWRYSNIGFLLLRQVIEAVSAASLQAALQERLFRPLALRHCRVAESLADGQQLTPGYSTFFAGDGSLQDVRPLYHPGWVSHGVVIATAVEVAQILSALFSGELISAPSRAALLTSVDVPVNHPFFQQPAYGLGIMVDRRSRYGLMAGHGGGGPGYSAGALHLPDVQGRHLTTVVLANCDRDDLGLELAFSSAMLVGKAVEDPE
jgi:D-alanyl-D-alanine carboxypeptidase